MSSTSFWNSAAPCRDRTDNRFTAISAPPVSTPLIPYKIQNLDDGKKSI
jgi:hypothetical protein